MKNPKNLKNCLIKSVDSKRLWVINSMIQFSLFKIYKEFVDFEYFNEESLQNYNHHLFLRKGSSELEDKLDISISLTDSGDYLIHRIDGEDLISIRSGSLGLESGEKIFNKTIMEKNELLIIGTENSENKTIHAFNLSDIKNIEIKTKIDLNLLSLTQTVEDQENVILIYPIEVNGRVIIYILTSHARLSIFDISALGKLRLIMDFTPIYHQEDFKSKIFINYLSLDSTRLYI